MDVRYYVDPDTGLPHIYGHGVSEDEVEDVLHGFGGDLPAKRGARMKIGQTAAGRYLQVVYSPDDDGEGLFVITAYDLGNQAKLAFRRRRRRRGT